MLLENVILGVTYFGPIY